MSVELPLVIFKWVKEASQYNADFIKSYNEDIQKDCMKFVTVYLKESKLEKFKDF